MLKRCGAFAFWCLLFGVSSGETADISAESENMHRQKNEQRSEISPLLRSFLNIKASHSRDNSYPLGPKNSSMVVANPFICFGDFVLDADFSYGRAFKYAGFLKVPVGLCKITGNLPSFFENAPAIRRSAQRGFENTVDKAHFYRNYTRLVYNDKAHDIKVICGDVATRNTIGFQQSFSGGGINIARQGGNGDTVNPGLPIVITKLTKAEVRLGGEILRVVILSPGTYTVDDLGEEARLPGTTIKLSDQVGRNEKLKIEYFSGYDMPDLGTDDFDLTMAFSHYWNVDDPYKIRYRNKPRFSGNYRFTPIENITFAVGGQAYNNSYGLDLNVIFMTEYGKIAPNIGFYDTYKGSKAAGIGIYYALPDNAYGVHLEASLSAQGRGYGDLGKSDELGEDYDYYMDKYFSALADEKELKNGKSSPENSRSAIVRLFTDPKCGFTPAFVFKGSWSNNHNQNTQNYREYSFSLTKALFEGCVVTAMAGLTYDDPTKGRNQESPDRRLTLACCVDLGSELSVKGTYSHLDGERMRKYGSVTYTPKAIEGLELCAEYIRTPGRSNPIFSVKYDNEYFGAKVEEVIVDEYEDSRAATRDAHRNAQLFTFGTSLTANGFRAMKPSNFNIIRTAEDFSASK